MGLDPGDTAFCTELARKRTRLMPTTVGADGRIMEWLWPYKEVEPHHRHVSQLYGLYPGDEISPEKTPKLAEAARRTLIARGDESTGWSMAWKINFWARLFEGEHAYKLLRDLLAPAIRANAQGQAQTQGGTFPNLFCSHPPFQIDGNFGATAGIAEMLLQSRNGRIRLLPALPRAWKTGSFSGLCARGGAIVGARWKNGRLLKASLEAQAGGRFRLELPPGTTRLRLCLNGKNASLPVIDGALVADLKKGDLLSVSYN
jgi:alpha-L-fucosidase 2